MNDETNRIRFGYRSLAMLLISAFGAVGMYWVRHSPSAVVEIVWVLGIVYSSVVGVSVAQRIRRPVKSKAAKSTEFGD